MFKSFIKLFKNKIPSPRFRIVVNKIGEYRVQARDIIFDNCYSFVDDFVFLTKEDARRHLNWKKNEIELKEKVNKLRCKWKVVE